MLSYSDLFFALLKVLTFLMQVTACNPLAFNGNRTTARRLQKGDANLVWFVRR